MFVCQSPEPGRSELACFDEQGETAAFIHLSLGSRRLKLHRSCVTPDSGPSPAFGSAAALFDALGGRVCARLPFDTIYRTSRQQEQMDGTTKCGGVGRTAGEGECVGVSTRPPESKTAAHSFQ